MATLYIVSTPIGNLGDISKRAVEILNYVDLILCEDTRVTGHLLHELEISKKMVAVNDFNEAQKVGFVVGELQKGINIALVSDAGSPLVSDPGFKVVREVLASGFKVESIPGPSAVISALVVSGLPTDKFMFIGYFSKKEGQRKNQIEDLKKISDIVKTTFICYESPFRVFATLGSINEVFGDTYVVVCRELTKIHEEVLRGKISEVSPKIKPKGEFVILF